MSSNKIKGDQFFFYFNSFILIIVVGAFGANALVNFEDLPPVSAIVMSH